MYIAITPVAKPRMTRQDKWKQRPAVMRYRDFAEHLLYSLPELIDNIHGVVWLVFEIPMPKSWSQKKKAKMLDTVHQQKPDIDNLIKSWLDVFTKDDSHVYEVHAKKLWSEEGGIHYGKDGFDWVSKAQEKKEEKQGPVQEQKKSPPRVGRRRNNILRGVSPRIQRG